MGTTRSTVLLCRVTNQTIVCSQTGHERGRERRSHIDPREHQQLITQIYVPIVHCLSSEADSAGPWRGPFDGRRLAAADPVGTSRWTIGARQEERTTERRREEIKGGPSRIARIQRVSKRGIQEVEEPSGRTTGEQPRPPQTHSSSFNSFGSPRFFKFYTIWYLRVSLTFRESLSFSPISISYPRNTTIKLQRERCRSEISIATVTLLESLVSPLSPSERFQRPLLRFTPMAF